MASNRDKVQLAIYDLSLGMASNLSRQFLGPNHVIDIIPHSGVLAYGMEYYFGGGIQSSRPDVFRRQHGGIQPVMILDVGYTNVSKAEFERWCRQTACIEYSPTSYDLLQRNCNNFADYALRDGLHLSEGVPQWVLDVPSKFLSSPLGGMLRPMLEQMQMSAPPVGAGGSSSASTTFTAPLERPQANLRTSAATTATRFAPDVANPWANIGNTAVSPSSPPPASSIEKDTTTTPLLDSHRKPLLSSDTATASLAVSKLKQCLTSMEGDSSGLLIDEETNMTIEALNGLQERLSTSVSTCCKSQDVRQSLHLILERVLNWNVGDQSASTGLKKIFTSVLSYSFMLLRLVVLRYEESGDQSALNDCIMLIVEKYFGIGSAVTPLIANIKESSVMVQSMAWCVLSNAVGGDATISDDIWSTNEENLSEKAIADCLHHAKKEVRQAASAFLYNFALYQNKTDATNDHLNDITVALLCSSIENLTEESDELVLFRRLLLVGLLIQSQATALSLCVDLGLEQVCREILQQEQSQQRNSIKLANELCVLLSMASK